MQQLFLVVQLPSQRGDGLLLLRQRLLQHHQRLLVADPPPQLLARRPLRGPRRVQVVGAARARLRCDGQTIIRGRRGCKL